MHAQFPELPVVRWLANYKEDNHDLLLNDPEFAQWLDEAYIPIAGGWQY
jgi:hypothetical protein